MNLDLKLLKHQREFINDITTRNLALIGGYGCGKTKVLATKLITLSIYNAGYEGIAVSPTFGMSTKNLIPEIEKQLNKYRIPYKFHKQDMVFDIHVCGKITKLHTMAASNGNWKKAAGLNAAFFGIDEADLLDAEDFAATWNMMSSRLRSGKVFQGVAVSTPEGFGGCYKFWVEDVEKKPELAESRRIIKASTYDNPYLPPEYITDLESKYPEELIKAYLMGEFVHLAGRPVYWKFDKELNTCTETLADFSQHILHIGQDFNKNVNAGVVCVIKNNKAYAIDELYGLSDAQALATEIKRRYPWHTANNAIRFYPDASGFEGIQTLKRNFPEYALNGEPNFRFSKSNPRVEKRVASVNAKFKPVNSAPECFVNPQKCPELMKGLTQQVYDKNQEPDKHSGIDHALDGFGYFINTVWPLAGNVTARVA